MSFSKSRFLAAAIGLGLLACQRESTPPTPLQEHRLDLMPPPAVLKPLVSFDFYADASRLHLLVALQDKTEQKASLLYLRSENGGEVWQAPRELTGVTLPTLESKIGNDLQLAARDQQLLAVWQVSGEIPGMGPLVGAASSDGGEHWQASAQPLPAEIDQSHADLAADSQGRFHLVWLDDREENGYQALRYANTDDNGQHWQSASTLDDSTCSCCWNRLYIDQQDRLHVLYRDGNPRDMALISSKDRGQSWQKAAAMSDFNWAFDGCPHNGGGVSGVADTLAVTQWTGADPRTGLYFVYSADAGKNWTAPLALNSPDGKAFHSDVVALDQQRIVAIWDARGAEGSTVLFAESFDQGQHWQAPRKLSTEGVSASFPRLVRTPQGALAAWIEQAPGGSKQLKASLLTR